ncbi:MAG: hypothetical protein KDC95_14205, partial [Planctomycetes bacterium]|nr:hypothetical protein [Planctomycetota bacterium]
VERWSDRVFAPIVANEAKDLELFAGQEHRVRNRSGREALATVLPFGAQAAFRISRVSRPELSGSG